MSAVNRLTQQQVWHVLTGVEPELMDYSLKIPNKQAAWHLQAELATGGQPLAERIARAVRCMEAAEVNTWLLSLLGGDKGILREAHAYGVLHQRGFTFKAPYSISSSELYRAPSSTGTVEVKLDGRFTTRDILFDVKALTAPGTTMDSLLNVVNADLRSRGLVAKAHGRADICHTELGERYPFVLRLVQEGIKNKQFRLDVSEFDLEIRIRELQAGAQIVGNSRYNPYRYAQNNSSFLLQHADQVPRDRKFMFVVAYSMATTSVLGWASTETMERALARRLFVEVERSTEICERADSVATVRQVVRSIGGVLFIGLDNDTVRAYFNPNAREPQKISHEHLAETTFNYSLGGLNTWDDFEFDNY